MAGASPSPSLLWVHNTVSPKPSCLQSAGRARRPGRWTAPERHLLTGRKERGRESPKRGPRACLLMREERSTKCPSVHQSGPPGSTPEQSLHHGGPPATAAKPAQLRQARNSRTKGSSVSSTNIPSGHMAHSISSPFPVNHQGSTTRGLRLHGVGVSHITSHPHPLSLAHSPPLPSLSLEPKQLSSASHDTSTQPGASRPTTHTHAPLPCLSLHGPRDAFSEESKSSPKGTSESSGQSLS